MDFSAIKELIQLNIRTNGSEDITGAVLQNVLLGIINTLGDDAINDVISALNDEITNRQNAVQDEADARIDAINRVTQLILDEVQARKDEIDSLELTDSTGSAVQNDRLKVSLNVNVGTEEEPETETITELTLPSVTSQKAGLMSVQLYNKLVNLVNGGYLFGGIALPSQNPGTPQTSVFYFASGAGTYTHFKNSDNDPIVIANDGLYVFTYDNVENQYWEFNQIYNPPIGYYECDTAGGTAAKVVAAAGYQLPVSGGSIKIKMINRNTVNNATLNINSTGAKPLFYNGSRANSGNTWDNNEVIEVYYDGTNYQAHNVEGNSGDGVFDISVYNASGDPLTPAVYEDLAAALGTNGVNIPPFKRKGGMSIKFIQNSVPSSDDKYVQFRYMLDDATTNSKFTNIANWQGVETDVTPNSKNLVESGSVYDFKDVFSILSKTNNIDLCFIDKNQNCLVYFKDGHIITKNFDSRNVANNLDFNVIYKDNGIPFSVEDNNGNNILCVDKDGNIASSNFLSKKAPISENTNLSFNFSVQDVNGNVVLLVKNGHIITQNFDSRGIAPIIGAVENNGFYINEWSGKNICFLGDSIIDNNFVCNVIKDTLKCNIYNRGWSGSMITPTEHLQGSQEGVVLTNKAYAFTNRCDYTNDNNPDNHHGAMPSADLIDLVVIHGGGNDYGHGNQTSRTVIGVGGIDGAMGNDLTYLPEGEADPTATVGSTFEAALKYTCYKVRQKYPNIPVAICTIFRSYDYINGNSFVSSHTEYVVNSDMSLTPNVRTYRDGVKNKDDFNNIIRSVARQFGMFIIDFDLFGMPSYNEYFGDLYYVHKESTGHGDLTHPSENYGAWNYGKFMAKEIMRIPYMDKSKVEDDSGDFPDNPEDD